MALSKMTKGRARWATFLSRAIGSVQRTILSKLSDTVSVKDFGAVGDGVTDDTASISAAIAHLVSLGGGCLYMPRGEYIFNGTIGVTSAITLLGDGAKATIIRGSVSLQLSGVGSGAYRSYHRLIGLQIDGVDRTTTGLHVYSNANFFVSDVLVKNCNVGVWNDGSLIGQYDRVHTDNCNTGVILGNAPAGTGRVVSPSNLVKFHCCAITACRVAIGDLDQNPNSPFGNDVLFDFCEIENNCIESDTTPIPHPAVQLSASEGVGIHPTIKFSHCWFESNKGNADIHFINETPNPRALILDACLVIGNSIDGVIFENLGGAVCSFVVKDCGLTSVCAGHSIKVIGQSVAGEVRNTTYYNYDVDALSPFFKVFDIKGQLHSDFHILDGKKLSLLGGGGTVPTEMYNSGNQTRVQMSSTNRIDTNGEALWHFDNLVRMGSFYMWFDSAGQLRIHNAKPVDKDTEGSIVQTN